MSRCFQSDSVGLRSAGDHTFLRRLSKDVSSAGRELRIMQILVTGASGMLGSHLIKELAGHGHEVVAWSATTEGFRDRRSAQEGGPG